MSEGVNRQVTQNIPKPFTTSQAGHILEYAVLSVLLLRAVRRFSPRGILIALAGTLTVALMDETLQELVPGRAFELTDLALDLAAALLGAVIFLLAIHAWKRINTNSSNEGKRSSANFR